MKLDQLTYFLAVARHEHVGKAAKALHISPSAISHSLKLLEDDLKCKLFEQKGRRIFITDAGRNLKERAEALLDQAEKIRADISSQPNLLRGHLRIAASHLLAPQVALPAWVELNRTHPGITGEILTFRSAVVIESILSGEADIGVCFSPQTHVSLQIETVYTGALHVAVKKSHPAFKKRDFSIKSLSAFPAALPKAFRGIEVCEKHPMFEKFSLEAHPTLFYDNYELAVEFANQSDGWTFLPDLLRPIYKNRLHFLPNPKGWVAPYQISTVRLANRAGSPSLNKFTDLLAKECQKIAKT